MLLATNCALFHAKMPTGCGSSLQFADWIALGIDPGTTIDDAVSSDTIMKWGASLLGFDEDGSTEGRTL